jgi:hypothetical protein
MEAYISNNYSEAVKQLSNSNGVLDATAVLPNASYLLGKEQFSSKNFKSARDNLANGIKEPDVAEMLMACDLMIAEDCYKKKDYNRAKEIYLSLPEGYEYAGVNAKNRLNSLKIYNSIEHLLGKYTVESGKYRVTQTHNRTGIYYYWYNSEKGEGSFEIKATIKEDGSVKLSGNAIGTRYTSFSSISLGVNVGTYYAPFDIEFTSSKIPTTFYSDDNITLKYIGGTKFTLSYSKTDNSQDVFFTYKYISNYTFSK